MQAPGFHQIAHACTLWRAQRQASSAYTDLLPKLPSDRPARMHELCDAVAAVRGCKIRVQQEPVLPAKLAALTLRYAHELVIVVNAEASRLTRWRGMAHELAHYLLGHLLRMSAAQRARLFPDLPPALVEGVVGLAPGHYPNLEEKSAEVLGGRLLAMVLLDRINGHPDGMEREDPAELDRQRALFRLYEVLGPLHTTLLTAAPNATLLPRHSSRVDRARRRNPGDVVSRLVIEIGDLRGLLLSQDQQHPAVPAVASIASDLARDAGLPARVVDATREAAMLAAAVRTVPPGTCLSPGRVACAARVDVPAELARLELVATAFTGPIVRAALQEHGPRGRGADMDTPRSGRRRALARGGPA
jgi:hypothetical protein